MTETFKCSECQCSYPIDPTRWQCDCGSPLDLEFNPEFPTQTILKRDPGLWRYREALPIKKDGSIVSMGEGFTPLEEMEFGSHRVWVKIDYLFPTGSYKDRGAAVLISKARELGIKKVVEDSSGNAGAAIAAYCSRAKIGCDIYVPQATSSGKLVQIQTYGANLKKIEGSREKTAQVTMEAAQKNHYASHCWNPFFLHGTKTFAFEIWEQMGWKPPDTLVLPVGHGTLLLGAYIGFRELREKERIKKIPRLVGIQSAVCAPLFKGFIKGLDEAQSIKKGETLAEGIAIAEPVRGKQILRAIRETDGEILTVTDREIRVALREMGQRGHFIEPTSAATIAGLKQYLKREKKKEVVVSTLTGT
ncbi:MAG: pyridoxal-phosphate dependent enzyme, partial [Deltaproteobacteria bacterium]|nr:pyridoxal-phosphate dependent enzyme [Deltaproteobacteria bacterium]